MRIHLSALTRRAFVTAFRGGGPGTPRPGCAAATTTTGPRMWVMSRRCVMSQAYQQPPVHSQSCPRSPRPCGSRSRARPAPAPAATGRGWSSSRTTTTTPSTASRSPLPARIPGVTFERGMRLADRIHNAGQAIVWQGQLEQAEHYWEQLVGLRADDGAADAVGVTLLAGQFDAWQVRVRPRVGAGRRSCSAPGTCGPRTALSRAALAPGLLPAAACCWSALALLSPIEHVALDSMLSASTCSRT